MNTDKYPIYKKTKGLDRSKHRFVSWQLTVFNDLTEAWPQICTAKEDVEIILPATFLKDIQAQDIWEMIISDGHLASVEYIKAYAEEIINTREQEASEPIICAKMVIANNYCHQVVMRPLESNCHTVPYTDLLTEYVLDPERYPIFNNDIDKYEYDVIQLSDVAEIVPFSLSLPNIIVVSNDNFYGFNNRLPSSFYNSPEQHSAIQIREKILPEYLLCQLNLNRNQIIYGTKPGTAGQAAQLRNILALKIPCPSRSIQLQLCSSFLLTPPEDDSDSNPTNSFAYSITTALGGSKTSAGATIGGAVLASLLPFGLVGKLALSATGAILGAALNSCNEDDVYRTKARTSIDFEEEKKFTHNLALRQEFDHQVELLIKMDRNNAADNAQIHKFMARIDHIDWKTEAFKFYDIGEKELDLIHQTTASVIAKSSKFPYQYQALQELSDKLHIEKKKCSPASEKIIDAFLCNLKDTMSALYEEVQRSNESAVERIKIAEQEAEEARIRADERECILNEVSHHIKNLVMSVVDPLKRLSDEETSDKKFILKSALSGAEMIKDIVACLNDSFRTVPEDLQYDLSHLQTNSPCFGDLLYEALRFSANNMFDTARHRKYVHGFFSQKNFEPLKEKWKNVRTYEEMFEFFSSYMFDFQIELPEKCAAIKIGNEKGSATKIMILLNELTMNALKALAFVPKEQRKLEIRISLDDENMQWIIKNSYDREIVTSSQGFGKTIIKNFISGFGGTSAVEEKDNIFKASLKIPYQEGKKQ